MNTALAVILNVAIMAIIVYYLMYLKKSNRWFSVLANGYVRLLRRYVLLVLNFINSFDYFKSY